jgi:hypothetical protein
MIKEMPETHQTTAKVCNCKGTLLTIFIVVYNWQTFSERYIL